MTIADERIAALIERMKVTSEQVAAYVGNDVTKQEALGEVEGVLTLTMKEAAVCIVLLSHMGPSLPAESQRRAFSALEKLLDLTQAAVAAR